MTIGGYLENKRRRLDGDQMPVGRVQPIHTAESPRINVLGVGINVVDMSGALQTIEGWIARQEQCYACAVAVSTIMAAFRDDSFKRILNGAGLNTPDGMPMVWLGKVHRYSEMDRVYGPDLMLALCELSARKGYRNFFYGGAEGVPEQLAARMKKEYPRLEVAGTFSPPFRPQIVQEDKSIVEMINKSRADILWVGLGSPKQEKWMALHVGRIRVPVMIGVGAAFDFHTGRVKQAPRWVQRSGMEWLYRLFKEPARLWRRYLGDNPLFLCHIFQQLLGLKVYPMIHDSQTEPTSRQERFCSHRA